MPTVTVANNIKPEKKICFVVLFLLKRYYMHVFSISTIDFLARAANFSYSMITKALLGTVYNTVLFVLYPIALMSKEILLLYLIFVPLEFIPGG